MMQSCPGCGANMKFDILLQKMHCPFCDSTADPTEMDLAEAKAEQMYETTIYDCPQCGGELTGDDNQASVFCPYCGNSTVLEGRLTKKVRPNYIIPFQVTKEDCATAYKKLLRRSVYAPKAMATDGVVDSFRGIYIPYWYFTAKQKGETTIIGYTENAGVDHLDQEYFDCTFSLDSNFSGITYDASELFDDRVSQAIGPFDVKSKKEFAPGYMSGFYADTYDVDETNYRDNAIEFVKEHTVKTLKSDSNFSDMHFSEDENHAITSSDMNIEMEKGDISLMPVWFMSFKFGDRMSYASINGQTGKAAGMIPASPLKYLLFSALTMIPIFFLLNLISFPVPAMAVTMANIIAMIVYIIYDTELTNTVFYEKMGRVQQYKMGMELTPEPGKIHKTISKLITAGLLIFTPINFFMVMGDHVSNLVYLIVDVLILIFMMVLTYASVWQNLLQMPGKNRYYFAGVLVGSVLSVAVQILNPVDDMWYYLCCIAQIIGAAFIFIDLIYYHNMICTRALPQFNRTGGDDSAQM